MSAGHVPVLLNEVLDQAAAVAREFGTLQLALDATFGRGGHSRALLERYPSLHIVALDQDPEAHRYAESTMREELRSGRLELFSVNFESIADFEKQDGFDFILFDLGVSSPQLDSAERGFSFYASGPLDMRMNPALKRSAADVISEASEEELVEIFREFGEVKSPFKTARAIVSDRKHTPFADTLSLARLIERVDGWQKKGFHPATQYFMALRLYVNRELEVIERALPEALRLLRPSGRMVVITFHSLEDRIVKQFFREQEGQTGESTPRRAVQPTLAEVESNSRSRSAKLRAFRRYAEGETRAPKNRYADRIGQSKKRNADGGEE